MKPDSTVSRFQVPDLGIGVGFRVPHYRQIIEDLPAMDWFEVISENFMGDGGSPLYFLDRLRAHYPVVMHGVSLNLGGPQDPDHLRRLKRLVDRVQPPWISDHLCWTGVLRANTHDLLPLPYTEDALRHFVDRIIEVKETLGCTFAFENPSSYMSFKASTMPEWEFVARALEEADCALLLDVNNVYVSSCNHGWDPQEYLANVPADRVVQIHLAGHSTFPTHRLDTHDHPVCDEVWDLYRQAIQKVGSVSTLIEWDDHIPSFQRLQEEAERARAVRDRALAERDHA